MRKDVSGEEIFNVYPNLFIAYNFCFGHGADG